MRTRVLIGLAAAVLLALAGVGFWWAQGGDAPEAPRADEPEQERNLGSAPEVRFTDVRHATWTLADLLDRPTVISFVALWCGTCELEVEEFKQVQSAHPGQYNFLLVDVDTQQDSVAALRVFADEHENEDFLFVFDEGETLQTAFGVKQLQTTVVVDTDGRIVHRDDVVTERAELEAVLAGLKP